MDIRTLPDGWTWTKLGDVCKWGSGGTPLRGNPEYFDGDIPWVIIGDLNDGIVTETQTKITQKGLENSSAKWVEAGSILLAMYGSIGKLGIAGTRLTTNQAIAFTKPESINAKYLFYYLMGERNNLLNRGIGATQQNISQTIIRAYPFPLAPQNEQLRIVGKIEELFTQLDSGTAALQRLQVGLKRYKASVLKAAFTGRLTNSSLDELQELEANGLPVLPETWNWVTWEMILAKEDGAFRRGPFGSTLKKSIFVKSGYKVYEQYCPINDDCSFGRYYITPELFKELKSFEVKPGDYLISCSGVTLGRITRVPKYSEKGIINQALLRVRIDENLIEHKYFVHYFRSPFFQERLFDSSTGTAIPNLKGVKELKALPIPLPPLAEQHRIVAEVERRLSFAQEIEGSVAASLQRAARLRQAVLKCAFEGRL